MNFSEPNRRTLKGTRAIFHDDQTGGKGAMLLGAGMQKRLQNKNDLAYS
jgi:hypothetical protein